MEEIQRFLFKLKNPDGRAVHLVVNAENYEQANGFIDRRLRKLVVVKVTNMTTGKVIFDEDRPLE